jgi:hypothetical protein
VTTDLARQEAQAITDPATGELIDRADTEKVADLYRRIQEVQAQWSDARAWCARALMDAADERSEWRFSAGGVHLAIDPPSAASIDWDMEELHKLEALLPSERYGELVVQTVIEKPQTGKLQALARQAGADSAVGEIIHRAERRKPRARYVKVAR